MTIEDDGYLEIMGGMWLSRFRTWLI